MIADAATNGFTDWCVVDRTGKDSGGRRISRARETSGVASGEILDAELAVRVPSYDALRDRVLASGRMEVWPGHHELPWCIAIPLMVDDVPYAIVTFVADDDTPGYGLAEISAAEEVVWNAATTIERLQLRHEAREAVRHSQRVASQLHQLIATSIITVGLTDTRDILLTLANRARSVFDADEAIVTYESRDEFERALARRTTASALVTASEIDPALPSTSAGHDEPWRVGDWFIAPILERRHQARGMVAFRRTASDGPDDEEILILLAQMAASSLGAAELNRTLASSEARWRALIQTAPVGIIEVDVNGAVQWWNSAAGYLFAWGSTNDTSDAPKFPDSITEDLTALWADAIDGGAQRSRELADVEIAGRARVLSVSATRLPGDAASPRVLTLVDDLTDQRQMTAELRHARGGEIRAQVASSVAHDFNNLLTLISGYTEMLETLVGSNDDALALVRDIQATTRRASQITQQLQTIGRTQARDATVVDVRKLLESNAEVIERIVGGNIEVTRHFDENAGNVLIDADQFEQVILNLVINARDAMEDGGELHLDVAGDGNNVLLRVRDTGTGMDEKTRERCFEPFFTTKGPFKGTGMGLSSARRLIESSGGTITVTSQLGVGTLFEVRLPLTDEVASPDVLEESAPIATGATVLVAEDDDALRRLMVQVLRRNGYRVLEGDNGATALRAAQGERLDALVTDVDMPVVGGVELALTLQAAQPHLAVLIVSGHADETVLAHLTPRSAMFVAKPFRPSELVDRVNELLVRAGARAL